MRAGNVEVKRAPWWKDVSMMDSTWARLQSAYWKPAVAALLLISLLVRLSFFNFLLFHTVVELFSILVGFGIAAIAFHTGRFTDQESNALPVFLGAAYFFIAFFDLFHTLAYEGMGVFPGSTANLATQLWIIPRYLEAFALLAVPFLVVYPRRKSRLSLVFPALSLILLALLLSGAFPDCFIPGLGLTRFKIVSEYIISLVLLLGMGLIIRYRHHFDRYLLRYMLLASGATILSELSFTFYVSVYGLSNMVGHLFKLASYYFIYQIVIRKKLLEPYETVQELYKSMERKVATRTRELEAANLRLRDGQKVLVQLNQKLGESNRLKSEFMATITHELRTPLTSIVAFCELLLDEVPGPVNNEQRENLMDIRAGAQQLMILINDILDMAKYEAGKLRLDKENADINQIFQTARRTVAPIAQQHHLRLAVHPTQLPPLYGDPDRIAQMIINLISNAVKFTKENGTIELSAREEDGFAAITVRDSGEGIPPELLPHIFEKFRQGDAGSKRRRGGTGLGLALVKTLAELHNGRVAVSSELGRGTEVTLYLPLAADDNN
jgi:signal transduction histidine kinase